MKEIKGTFNSRTFQSMSISRELFCAASQSSDNLIVITSLEDTIKELLTFTPMAMMSGTYTITGKLFYLSISSIYLISPFFILTIAYRYCME